MIEVESVTCYYGAVKVLNALNLSAHRGEFFGIIGPNGSGKTTLLKCISGIIKPEAGRIVMGDADISSLGRKELARGMAAVPQQQETQMAFTALEVVLMGRIPHLGRFQQESRKDLDIATRSMELTNSLQFADRPINELSGGERQRVFIARALAQEPKLLLLDEPTANLDISYQLEILNLVKEMAKKEELTALVAIHDLNLAAQYCDRMALLDRGEVVSLGAPEEVLTPDNIKSAFRIDAVVKRHEVTSSLYVTPVQVGERLAAGGGTKVHLICGAGTGSSLMSALVKEGYEVTAGVLNALDTDHETARQLGLTVIDEAPFSPITEESHAANLRLIENSGIVVMTSLPFGPGNLLNLKAAKFALGKGIPLFIFRATAADHEFVYEEAESLLKDIKEAGLKEISSAKELMKVIEELEK